MANFNSTPPAVELNFVPTGSASVNFGLSFKAGLPLRSSGPMGRIN
jgi:hypothetical protein